MCQNVCSQSNPIIISNHASVHFAQWFNGKLCVCLSQESFQHAFKTNLNGKFFALIGFDIPLECLIWDISQLVIFDDFRFNRPPLCVSQAAKCASCFGSSYEIQLIITSIARISQHTHSHGAYKMPFPAYYARIRLDIKCLSVELSGYSTRIFNDIKWKRNKV